MEKEILTDREVLLLRRKLDLLLRTGKLLMESAADTNRIERNMKRVAAFMGIPEEKLHLDIRWTMIMVNVSDETHSFSKFQKCEKHGINMTTITEVSRLSWKANIEHNDSMDTKRRQERMKRYRVETKSFRIGQQLADALYNRITDMIEHFDSRYEGRYAAYSVTFRCVVGNEVWTLFFRDVPQGETLALSDLCMRMLRDAKTDDWAEAEYLNLLSR